MIFFSGSTRLAHPPNSPSQIPKNHQIHHSMYQKHQTNHAKHQTNHAKYKIHHLLFTLSGQHTASPPRGQHPNPPSSNWKDIRLEGTKEIGVFIDTSNKEIIQLIGKWGKVYTNWTAGLRVVTGVLRVWAGFPVGGGNQKHWQQKSSGLEHRQSNLKTMLDILPFTPIAHLSLVWAPSLAFGVKIWFCQNKSEECIKRGGWGTYVPGWFAPPATCGQGAGCKRLPDIGQPLCRKSDLSMEVPVVAAKLEDVGDWFWQLIVSFLDQLTRW